MSIAVPIDQEYMHEDSVIISQTDSKGIITYANKKFCEVSGYLVNELVGASHNIIRHPSMPKEIFFKMWKTISAGQVWNGLVKNLRKDGLYYWVEIEILPIKSDDGTITGYIAVCKHTARKNIVETQELYDNMTEEA